MKAGSGNPASSVSSGRVEAEGCGSWEYNEGVGGQYTCAGCGARPLRSAFLIEATDLEGKLCVEREPPVGSGAPQEGPHGTEG